MTNFRCLQSALSDGMTMISEELAGQVTLVTGASRGIGEAIARQRQDWVLASKGGIGPADNLPNRSDLSRKRIFNALDFHIAFHVGQIAGTDPQGFFHIISKDKGYDPLLAHLKEAGIQGARSESIATHRPQHM